MLEAVLASAEEGLFDAEGMPIAWPVALAGDKGYRAEWIDAYLLELERVTKLKLQPVVCPIRHVWKGSQYDQRSRRNPTWPSHC